MNKIPRSRMSFKKENSVLFIPTDGFCRYRYDKINFKESIRIGVSVFRFHPLSSSKGDFLSLRLLSLFHITAQGADFFYL